jgi:hypothetical protein
MQQTPGLHGLLDAVAYTGRRLQKGQITYCFTSSHVTNDAFRAVIFKRVRHTRGFILISRVAFINGTGLGHAVHFVRGFDHFNELGRQLRHVIHRSISGFRCSFFIIVCVSSRTGLRDVGAAEHDIFPVENALKYGIIGVKFFD